MPEGPVGDTPTKDERAPDFFSRTTPVLPELHWVGAAIQEGRFDDLAGLFPEPDEREQKRREHLYDTADPAVPLAKVRERFTRLAELAKWPPELFLHTIAGLPGSPEDGLPEPPTEAPDFAALNRAAKYLELLEEMAAIPELRFDQRHVIQEGPELLYTVNTAGERLLDVETLRVAMQTVEPSHEGDGLNAWDYLKLGEVDSATDAVKAVFEGIALDVRNPFFVGPMTHISTTRMGALHRGNIDVIGEETAARMRNHITGCKGCGESWRYLEDKAVEKEAIRRGAVRLGQPD
ncbi:MAG TPA: hypothetical protein VIF43_01390 [Patescibacteria group bacterium]|jgi:hypothetical protein